MSTVIAVHNEERCIATCDARCYNAKRAKCRCICGGRNHSAGQDRAIENTRDMIGLRKADLVRFACEHVPPLDPNALCTINRLDLSARTARHAATLKIGHQMAGQKEMFDE